MEKECSKQLLDFIKKSPTAFHAISNIKKILLENNFIELVESKKWTIEPGGNYFVTRNGTSIIAFKAGSDLNQYSFNVVASHSDSPTFKVKENGELSVKNKYVQLNTEGYGGMICSSWLDRPLSIAGRAMIKQDNKYVTKLVNVDKDLLLIPNVAIHMNRNINDGFTYNKQIDLLPLMAIGKTEDNSIKNIVAKSLNEQVGNIYGMDLYLYNRVSPTIWGANDEFISASQLDDLQCAYSSLKGFIDGYNNQSVNVLAVFDNEEVGSLTKQGAASTFLVDVLKRLNNALGFDEETYHQAVASSFMLSSDNAHAMHPNHPEKSDANNQVYINEGVVVKVHAGQKYTSDAMSIALFKAIAKDANVPLQFFANRSDSMGGSTLGNIAMSQVSINSIDIGLPQLAMHSAYETAGIKDTYYMIKIMKEFYDSHFNLSDSGIMEISK